MQIIIPEFSRSPYALIVMLSVAFGYAAAIFRMRKSGVNQQTIFYISLLSFVCTMAGSFMLAFKITSEGIGIGFSGLGAAVGMVTGVMISGLIIRDKPDIVMTSFVVSAPLMYGLAKIGCFLAGCCHGKEYYGPFAVVYSNEHAGSYFPIQLVDMVIFILLHVFALLITNKMKNKVRALYIILGVMIPIRFALEYTRYYHDGSLVAPGQVTILIAGTLGILMIFIWKKILKISYN